MHLTRKHCYIWTASLLLAVAMGCSSNADENAAAEDAPQAGTETGTSSQPAAPTPSPAQPTELAASHILIQYEGSTRAAATITRSKEEALKLAQELAERAKAGADFAALAREHSDGPSAPGGGNLGIFPSNRMVPEFSAACMDLKVGGTSGPVETQFGYHVIRRNEIEKVAARHILIMHKESARAPETVTRTKDEALTLSREVLQKATSGESFTELAAQYSDGPSNTRGGDLGSFGKGAMVPAFDEAAFALDVGGMSDIVETPFGYHIILRYQ